MNEDTNKFLEILGLSISSSGCVGAFYIIYSNHTSDLTGIMVAIITIGIIISWFAEYNAHKTKTKKQHNTGTFRRLPQTHQEY